MMEAEEPFLAGELQIAKVKLIHPVEVDEQLRVILR